MLIKKEEKIYVNPFARSQAIAQFMLRGYNYFKKLNTAAGYKLEVYLDTDNLHGVKIKGA